MKLTDEQRKKLLDENGIAANEACDACGKILDSTRWKRRNEPGEWCSRECRDGKAEADRREARRIARAGRPRKYKNAAQRREANSGYQRRFREKQVNPVPV